MLNRGDRSDRGVIRWDLEPAPGRPAPAVIAGRDRSWSGRPGPAPRSSAGGLRATARSSRSRPTSPRCASAIPEVARAWRDAVAEGFEACLGAGLVATAFDREPQRVRLHATGRDVTRIRSIELRLVGLPLVTPFRTSFGEMTHKECVLARVETDDAVGWGECVAGDEPDFSEEWNEGAWLVLRDLLAPALVGRDVTIEDVERRARVRPRSPDGEGDARERGDGRGAPRATASRSRRPSAGCAIASRAASRSGSRRRPSGCSSRSPATSREGYRRIKLKIEPGTDVERVPRRPRGAPGHPPVGRRERRVLARGRPDVPTRSMRSAC